MPQEPESVRQDVQRQRARGLGRDESGKEIVREKERHAQVAVI